MIAAGTAKAGFVPASVARAGVLTALLALLAACGGGSSPRTAYDDGGKERISVLTSTQQLDVDPSITALPVTLPAPYRNGNWAQPGGNPPHAVYHLSLPENMQQVWRTSIGQADRKYERMVTGPIAANGRVYVVDAAGQVSALDLASGNTLWRSDLDNNDDRSRVGFGGGTAFWNDTLYVTSGYGYVVAMNPDDGSIRWRFNGQVPFRGGPTVADGRVFAVTHDNRMLALNADTGEMIWDQVGIAENAGMLGAASPAYDGSSVVMALSSGELIAMQASNGRILWQDSLTSSRRLTPLATLSDIDGHPVIDRGKLYALSHAGSMVSIDMRSGERSWEADIAGVNTLWVAGSFGFLTTIDGQLVCMSLSDGRVRWVTQLQRFLNQEKRRDLVKWNGPVLAGNRLLVTSSHGYALSVSPYTGEVLAGVEIPGGSAVEPVVVDDTFLVQTTTGELIAYR